MPFPKKCNDDDDPEEIAEREYAKMNEALGISDSRKKGRIALHAAPQPSPVKLPTKQPKVAKALRKMRNRGVSGSSIKKDGGRFDYGLDYDEDYDDRTEDMEDDEYLEYARYTRESHSVEKGLMGSDSEQSNDSVNVNLRKKLDSQVVHIRDCLVAALSSDDGSIGKASVADLLIEECDETARVRLICDAISLICLAMDKIAADPFCEHRLVVMVSGLIRQGLLKASSVSSYVESALESNHAIRLLSAANKVGEDTVNESEQMCGIEKLAKELAEEFDTEGVERDLIKQGAVYFHAHFIHQLCLEAIGSMHMNVIYHATRAIADMVKNSAVDETSVNIGFLRFFRKIVDMEMDLPGATSLATLLMSYAVNDFHLLDENVSYNCPKPRRFIRADRQGMISVVEKDGVHCTTLNYFSMES